MARSILAVLTLGLLAQPALASSYSPGTSSLPLDAPANPQGHHTVPCVGLLKEGGSLESLLPDDFDRSRVECGLFDVPLDWTRPRFTQDQLYYTKYRAADDAVREGTIFISPCTYSAGPPHAMEHY
ncbi:hypothetical protein GY45DRAFT_1075368 [Cubamyces sp. BRFM 1775]|nr:hypothetical protein GY45DRAFT_1075368 [Cubamyces sp. BRFM 1775]